MSIKYHSAFKCEGIDELGSQPAEPGPESEPRLPEPQPEEPQPIDPIPFPDFRDVPPVMPID